MKEPEKEFWDRMSSRLGGVSAWDGMVSGSASVIASDNGVCAVQINAPGRTPFINGYCAIPVKMIPEKWKGYEYYIPDDCDIDIHGGITFFELRTEWAVYGFDHAHFSDMIHGSPGPAEVLEEAKHLREQILERLTL